MSLDSYVGFDSNHIDSNTAEGNVLWTELVEFSGANIVLHEDFMLVYLSLDTFIN